MRENLVCYESQIPSFDACIGCSASHLLVHLFDRQMPPISVDYFMLHFCAQ